MTLPSHPVCTPAQCREACGGTTVGTCAYLHPSEVEAARLRTALEKLPERVRALGGFQKFREGEVWVSRDDVLRLLDEALNGGEHA